MKLTEEQLAAVNHNTGHARIIAVAGAGKTATLTHYLAARLQEGADPRRILVLMYNRAAKDAFEQRLHQHGFTQRPTIRTFHALGLKLYQRLINHGLLPQTSLNPLPNHAVDLQIKLLLQANSQASQKLQNNEAVQEWVETTGAFIQLVKCHLHGPEYTFDEIGYPEEDKFLIQVFQQFEDWRKSNSAITYDDMLYDPAKVFECDPESHPLVSDILDEVLVDEYQDINPIQHYLLKIISGKRAKIIVIGDPDQTIYEFRGSSPSFINQIFAQDFNSPTKYSLSKTFRFGHELSLAANHLITHNKQRDPILTISAEGTPNTNIHLAETDNHGHKIATTIESLHSKGAPYSGIVILCRLWSFARPVELQLMALGIPYGIEGEQSILQCFEVRPLMHLLNILSKDFFTLPDQKKAHNLFEILSIPSPKVPHKILHDIAKKWGQTIEFNNIHGSLKKSIPSNLSSYQQKSLSTIVKALKALKNQKTCALMLQKYAITLDYQTKLQDTALNPTKGEEQVGTVNAFLKFLHTLKVTSAADIQSHLREMQSSHQGHSNNAVTITTIHRSKGREWPAVFIPDVTEGHLPYISNNKNDIDFDTLESERRLMYVAITRAQKKLFLTTSIEQENSGHKNGKTNDQATQSRFIKELQLESCQQVASAIVSSGLSVTCQKITKEITERYLRELGSPIEVIYSTPSPQKTHTKHKRYKNKKRKGPLHYIREGATPRDNNWAIGDRVKHNALGTGEVVKLEGEKLKICFDKGGIRTFVSHLAEPHLSLEK